MGKTYCNFCHTELEPSREFIDQFESLEFIEDEGLWGFVRNMATYEGEPLRLCKLCSDSVNENLANQKQDQENEKYVNRLSFGILAIGMLFIFLFKLIIWFDSS